MIISFAWTTPALLAGQKTVTRRAWVLRHATKFHAGMLVDAYDKNPHWGGKKVAEVRLTETPYLQSLFETPPADWYNEGFEYLQAKGYKVDGRDPIDLWREWMVSHEQRYVVRFELVSVLKPDTPLANLTLKPDTCQGVNP